VIVLFLVSQLTTLPLCQGGSFLAKNNLFFSEKFLFYVKLYILEIKKLTIIDI